MRNILTSTPATPCLLVGNGVNLFGENPKETWAGLLNSLRESFMLRNAMVEEGVTFTELYDLLEMERQVQVLDDPFNARSRKVQADEIKILSKFGHDNDLLQLVADETSRWSAFGQHHRIVDWCMAKGAPLLTTNFDRAFEKAVNQLRPGEGKYRRAGERIRSTRFPWDKYYAAEELAPLHDGHDPSSGFGVWHVNGDAKAPRSINLGLTHYMAATRRAYDRLYGRYKNQSSSMDLGLLAGGEKDQWRGVATWLQPLFHRPVLIFGLALDETEVFIRWLLIERAKYLMRLANVGAPPDMDWAGAETTGWYVQKAPNDGQDNPGKRAFLKALGLEVVDVEDYDDIYGEAVWSAA